MQIIMNQDEITAAVEAAVRNQIALQPGQKISIDFTAGRGQNGLTATLEISASGTRKTAPVMVSVPRAVDADAEGEEPRAPGNLPTQDPAEETDPDGESDGAAETETSTADEEASRKSIFAKKAS